MSWKNKINSKNVEIIYLFVLFFNTIRTFSGNLENKNYTKKPNNNDMKNIVFHFSVKKFIYCSQTLKVRDE